MIEQMLCAFAPVVVMCLDENLHRGQDCGKCARGMRSGYVSGIVWLRESFGIKVASDVDGGIWQWSA